ncbi:hypothetical protein J0X19_14965 [Hymenobacter sp. BT186]|uniref:DUF3575 domain-containing protein n=1 Tax=Hymenobacter telluris TaxID=2816474 RepID=A0A939JBL2_9BACT|nr:hypothetical protein [Hymenobacter telluris]MBO0359261.1 hypothetical protein [Hymenobacter telluris]MBW3375287.1 hypothetical protein [Hymenobacter norwichensis]
MYSLVGIPSLSMVVGALLFVSLPAAAQTPDSTAVRTRPIGTLITLGTGIVTPGFEFGGFGGLSLPLILSVEHHLSPAVSLYANGFSGFHLYNGLFDQYRRFGVGYYGFDAGIRYYYNQEKRRLKGRPTGPFVGNYVALQASSVFRPAINYSNYRYSGLTAIWGMQRRVGKYGWLNTYVGAGIGRSGRYYYTPEFENSRYGLLLELGVKVSLGSRLTR